MLRLFVGLALPDGVIARLAVMCSCLPGAHWVEATNMHLTTTVNGELRQDTTTSLMIMNFVDLITYVSQFTTLKPGDVISTGTPVGTGMGFDPPKWLKAGDVV